jgi:biopolymer transport protein ExbD
MINSGANTHRQDSLIFPDMTALLDVIFILLVFLLLTANVAPKALQVNLPEQGSASTLEIKNNQPLTITLFAEHNRWGIDSREFSSWTAFEAALTTTIDQMAKTHKQSPEIILAGDQSVSLKQLLKVFGWLQENNLQAASILMKHPESP